MPLQPVTIQTFKGLAVQANSFQVPDGSLEIASNVVISNDGILRKRRGFSLLAAASTMVTPSAMADYSGVLFVAQNSKLSSVNVSTGVLTDLSGTLVPPVSNKIRFARAAGNMYATTSTGIKKIETTTSAILPCGIPGGLDVTISFTLNLGISSPNKQIGYRVLFGRKDANANKYVGAPSELTIVTNSYLNSAAAYAGIKKTVTNALWQSGSTVRYASADTSSLSVNDTLVISGFTKTLNNGTFVISAISANAWIEVANSTRSSAADDETKSADARKPTATITITSNAHGFSNGDAVVLAGSTDANLNGEWTVASAAANTFLVTTTSVVTQEGTTKVGKYRTPTIEFSLPSGMSTEYFYQIYRTLQSSDALVTAADDGQLIYEANLTAGQVSAGVVTFLDDVEELFKGAELYTNPSQGGIAFANFEPPLAKDMCLFKDCLFFANVESKHSLEASVVSAQAADFANGTFITVTSGATTHRYVASTTAPTPPGAAPNVTGNWNFGGLDASGHVFFQLTNSSTTTVASAVAATAKSLCKAINRHTAGLIYAYYLSGPDDIPGRIRFAARNAGASFVVKAENATTGDAFSPNLFNSDAGQPSTNSAQQNVVYFSKPQEVEAVPLPYSRTIGSKSNPILRIIPLRDSIMVLKTDGLFRISGDSPSSFQVSQVDGTIICKAPESAVALNNQVFFLSTQGVVAATEDSANVISRSIESLLTPIVGSSVLTAQTSAVGYESERLYLLSTIQPGSSTADVVYCYNTVTTSWTTWDKAFKDALVFATDDKLYAIDEASDLIEERKSQNLLDYCEESFSLTCTSVSGFAAQLSGAATIEVGDVLVKAGDLIIYRVVGVNTATTPQTVTFTTEPSFLVDDTCIIYKPVLATIRTSPLTLGDPTVWKQFSDFQVVFRNRATTQLILTFQNDSRGGTNETVWNSLFGSGGWGFDWGEQWGGPTIDTVFVTQKSHSGRVYVPAEVARGTFIQANVSNFRAAESMEIQAMSYSARTFGNTTTR